MEARLDRDKRELKAHIDAAQGRLDRKVTNLETVTRSQLAALARGAALERSKCRQRHLHLEQWLLRGSVLRRSRPVRARSFESVLELPEAKQRSSSREGKESGKGSSEVVGPGSESEEEKVRRSTRAMSERIDEVLRTANEPETMERLYGDLIEWRKNNKGKKPKRESVQDIIAKFQKQQSVQELVARIQRKTDKIHQSARKWKERRTEPESESSDEEEEVEESLDPALRRLPYRCRDTVYSPDLASDPAYVPSSPALRLRQTPTYGREGPSPNPYAHLQYGDNLSIPEESPYRMALPRMSEPQRGSYSTLLDLHHKPHPSHFLSADNLTNGRPGSLPLDSPQPDSGYSTKPWGSSPSPPVTDTIDHSKRNKPPVPVRKFMRPTTASLV